MREKLSTGVGYQQGEGGYPPPLGEGPPNDPLRQLCRPRGPAQRESNDGTAMN